MLYRFKTRHAGDVIMTAPVGDAVLRAAGREPAAQGIVEAGALPAVIQALEAAIAAEEARAKQVEADGATPQHPSDDVAAPRGLGLRQRAWPFLEMLRRAQRDGEPVVWGV